MSCTQCGHHIGRLERLQIRIAMRVFRKASKRFKLNLHVEKYIGNCKGCMLKAMEQRVENLKIDVYNDLHKSNKTQEELVAEVKEWVEKEAGHEAKKGARI